MQALKEEAETAEARRFEAKLSITDEQREQLEKAKTALKEAEAGEQDIKMRKELDEIHREIITEQQRDLLDAVEAKQIQTPTNGPAYKEVSETLRTLKIELGILNPT